MVTIYLFITKLLLNCSSLCRHLFIQFSTIFMRQWLDHALSINSTNSFSIYPFFCFAIYLRFVFYSLFRMIVICFRTSGCIYVCVCASVVVECFLLLNNCHLYFANTKSVLRSYCFYLSIEVFSSSSFNLVHTSTSNTTLGWCLANERDLFFFCSTTNARSRMMCSRIEFESFVRSQKGMPLFTECFR